jgi:hypothetical protein
LYLIKTDASHALIFSNLEKKQTFIGLVILIVPNMLWLKKVKTLFHEKSYLILGFS